MGEEVGDDSVKKSRVKKKKGKKSERFIQPLYLSKLGRTVTLIKSPVLLD